MAKIELNGENNKFQGEKTSFKLLSKIEFPSKRTKKEPGWHFSANFLIDPLLLTGWREDIFLLAYNLKHSKDVKSKEKKYF